MTKLLFKCFRIILNTVYQVPMWAVTGNKKKLMFKLSLENQWLQSQDSSASRASNQILKFRLQLKICQLAQGDLKSFCKNLICLSFNFLNQPWKIKSLKNYLKLKTLYFFFHSFELKFGLIRLVSNLIQHFSVFFFLQK